MGNAASEPPWKGITRERRARPEDALIRLPRLVACRRKIGRALRDHRVNGLGNRAVLEHRLCEIHDVVDDHARAVALKSEDIVREARHPVERGGESQGGSGCDIVHDLQHGAPLVRSVRATRDLLDDLDRRQVAGCDVPRRAAPAVEAVGQGADLHSRSGHTEGRARHVGAHGLIALTRDRTDVSRGVGRLREAQVRNTIESGYGVDREAARHDAPGHGDVLHAQRGQCRLEGRHITISDGIDDDMPVGHPDEPVTRGKRQGAALPRMGRVLGMYSHECRVDLGAALCLGSDETAPQHDHRHNHCR